jgi:hypothetical protein
VQGDTLLFESKQHFSFFIQYIIATIIIIATTHSIKKHTIIGITISTGKSSGFPPLVGDGEFFDGVTVGDNDAVEDIVYIATVLVDIGTISCIIIVPVLLV